eukprot:6269093-Lingulodinium_polyedra.AAC.1
MVENREYLPSASIEPLQSPRPARGEGQARCPQDERGSAASLGALGRSGAQELSAMNRFRVKMFSLQNETGNTFDHLR